MSSRSAIHQLRANRPRLGSSSQAHNVLYGWKPESESERGPNPFDGPPLSDFTRGLPRRNRAPSGRRPSASKTAAGHGEDTHQRRPSLVEKLRAVVGRRLSETTSSVVSIREPRKKRPSLEVARGRRFSNASLTAANSVPPQKREPSLVEKAKEFVNRPGTNPDAGPFSAIENEKIRLSIESRTRSFELIQRWKDPNDWLKPSNFWKRKHPAMNFRLWRIIQRNPVNHPDLQASAARNLEAAKLFYDQKGGNSEEWWPEDLEEEILDSWSLCYGGVDPPCHEWGLEE